MTQVLLPFRIGEGWDVHALVPGRPLIIGGVTIPHTMGLLGHSDADVLLHAITDALLGAAGLGDIGRHFPDTDLAFKGADSGLLLQEAMRRVRAATWARNTKGEGRPPSCSWKWCCATQAESKPKASAWAICSVTSR